MNHASNYILPKLLLALLTVALLAGGSLAAPMLDQSQDEYSGRAAVFDDDLIGSVEIAQTFRPSVSNYLDYIELYVCDKPWGTHEADAEHPLLYPHHSATISIVQTGVGGAPTGSELGHVDVSGFVTDTNVIDTPYNFIPPAGQTPNWHLGWNKVDFPDSSLWLVAETLYAIVITNGDTDWEASPTDTFLVYDGKIAGTTDHLVDIYDRGILWERDRTFNPAAGWTKDYALDYPPGFADAAFRTYMVPEPAALLLLLGAALVLLLIRRRTHRTRILCISPVQSKPSRILRGDWEELKMVKTLTPMLTFVFALAFVLPTGVSKAAFIHPPEASVELDVFIGDPGDVELYVLVRADDTDEQLVYFEFRNESNEYCSIEGIYFQDGSLLGIPTVVSGPGTAFSQGASPGHLPDSNQFNPPFITHAEFLADSDSPVPHNGVEPGEWVEILFDLQQDCTFADVMTELNDLTLRIGVHVIAFPDGSSYSAVNPEPATLMLLAAAAGMAVFFRKSPYR